MNRYEFIDKLIEKILPLVPAVENAPQEVKDVYASAVEYFGEEAVDLQLCLCKEAWVKKLSDYSFKVLLEYLGIEGSFENSVLNRTWFNVIAESDAHTNYIFNNIKIENLSKMMLGVYSIIIHFKDLTVSNEDDVSTQIEDMYVNVPVMLNGCSVGFMFWRRTTISKKHYLSNYRHSHLRSGRDCEWLVPCLGSGPILMTFESISNSDGAELWPLFWLELDRCVRVESLQGGPYIHIADISAGRQVNESFQRFSNTRYHLPVNRVLHNIQESLLLKLLHSGKLKYSFCTDHIEIINPFAEFTVIASDALLECLRDLPEGLAQDLYAALTENRYISQCKILTSGRINSYGMNYLEVTASETPIDMTFKGQPVLFKITSMDTPEDESIYTLVPPIVSTHILGQLTTLINNIYARKYSKAKVRANKES